MALLSVKFPSYLTWELSIKKSFLPQLNVYINYKIFFLTKILCFITISQKNISLTAIISSSLLIASDEIPPCVIK